MYQGDHCLSKNSLRRPPQRVLLDKTNDADDVDPGRQAGAFLATNSWKRLLQLRLPGQVRGFWPRAREADWLRVSRAYPLSYCISRVPASAGRLMISFFSFPFLFFFFFWKIVNVFWV